MIATARARHSHLKRYLILTITAIALAAPTGLASAPPTTLTVAEAPALDVGCEAEWHRPREILVHTPGEEVFLGVIHPKAALFERAFSTAGAAAEHDAYVRLLRDQGSHVHTVVGTLLAGTIDRNGHAVEGPALESLRALAQQFLRISSEGFPDVVAEKKLQESYKTETVRQLHPRDLVKIILLQPEVMLRPTGALNTGYVASYMMSPVMNLYFMRDQMITTRKGVVLGRMDSEQRRVETQIAKFVLEKLGITLVYEVQEPGQLEGGDFIPAGDTAFIGQGLRTNEDAIRQLLEHDAFGTRRIVVVKEPWKEQEQMHLDTYFNVLAPDLAVLVVARMNRDQHGNPREVDVKKKLLADVYESSGGAYELVQTNVDFQSFLEEQMGMKLIPVPDSDQLKYGVNFLTVGPRKILGVDGVSEDFKDLLKAHGVRATWMDFSNLSGGYGAAHCTVQVLRRAP